MLNFNLDKAGKSSFSATSEKKTQAAKGNANFYPGKAVVRIPAVSTKKGFGTILVFSAEALKGLGVTDTENAYIGVIHQDGANFLINLAGTMDIDTLKKDIKYARVTPKGTASSKYIVEALDKAGYPENEAQDVEVAVVSGSNVKGALKLGNIIKTLSVQETESESTTENVAETGNAETQEDNSEVVEEAIVEDAVVETTEEAVSNDEFEW